MRRAALTVPAMAVVITGVLASCQAVNEREQAARGPVTSDIAFARSLALELHYFDLAEEVLASAEGRQMPATVRDELDLAKCKVKAEKARTQEVFAFNHDLHEEAVDAYRGYLQERRQSIYLREAQFDYVVLCNSYSQELESLLEVTGGAEAKELRQRIEGVLQDALQVGRELLDAFYAQEISLTLDGRRRFRTVSLSTAQMVHTWARLSQRADLLQDAERILENITGSL